MNPTLALLAALALVVTANAQVPSILNYQGRVSIGGSNYNGNGQFKFALVNADGSITHWNNAGTTSAEPASSVSLVVTQGLYSTILGDTATANMAAIPAGVFTNNDLRLRVWFRASTNGAFMPFTPDQRLGSAPYAMAASSVRNAGATGFQSFVGGAGTNTASGEAAFIGGGRNNTASNNFAAVAGGSGNSAIGIYSFVGGGTQNATSDGWATVGGGDNNTAGGWATVAGGQNNAASGSRAAVGGGAANSAVGNNAVVAGGFRNTAAGARSTVGGGDTNTASGNYATVAGGYQNSASGSYSSVSGGRTNTAIGDSAAVGGGEDNEAIGFGSTVGGGYNNTNSAFAGTLGGGQLNAAGRSWATVGGGYSNTASGNFATVPGGTRSKATNTGSFVWSGVDQVETVSTNNFSFTVRAPGGARFLTATNNSVAGVIVEPNATAWTVLSDRDTKTNFAAIDKRELLAKLAALPVSSWSYKHDPARRYIGPTAQDFLGAFHLGHNDKGINTLDADGVTFAAIQGLVEELQARDARIERLENDLEEIRQQLGNFPPAP